MNTVAISLGIQPFSPPLGVISFRNKSIEMPQIKNAVVKEPIQIKGLNAAQRGQISRSAILMAIEAIDIATVKQIRAYMNDYLGHPISITGIKNGLEILLLQDRIEKTNQSPKGKRESLLYWVK